MIFLIKDHMTSEFVNIIQNDADTLYVILNLRLSC